MTVFEMELTEDEIIEETEDADLEVEADEVLEVPVAVPTEWDHSLLKNRDAEDSHPLSAITGADALKEKLDGIEKGAQANVIETVAVNDVPLTVSGKLVNISVPTSYGWTLDLDESGTIYLKDKAGGVLSKIETGLDRVVKSGYFDDEKVEIVLVLDDDSEIRISASSLVDIYTADGYYLTVSKGRVFGLTDNAKKILTDSTAHIANKTNPHEVTKAQVGLGNADNTADLKKPISEATQAALDLKADADDVTAHVKRTDNPHSVTKAQIGLGSVDNTADLAKPVSIAQKAALDLKAEKESTEAHIANKSNPHEVTKAQVGLGNADDTSDKDKPISTATQAALDKKADATALSTHTTNVSNPHKVTKAQVGLGNADNTSDADKPVSTAQQEALDLKADISALNAHKADASNPHKVTKAQVGLGNVDNTSDINKPVSTAQQAALDLKADKTALSAHEADKTNPHEVTAAQVGLGNVDNTSDLSKPISTATQTALDGKVDKISGKGLSSNDYTSAEKTKLAGIAAGAQVNVIEKIAVNGTEQTVSFKTVDISVPTKTSGITNDSGYITNAVNDLVNYYTKLSTYTKTEVNSLIAGVTWTTAVVESLPSTGAERTIYFVPKEGDASDTHDEYIWVENAWELIGSTQVTIEVVNSADGITVAGQALQTATTAHPGLMTVAQVDALAAKADASALTAHTGRTDNPHKVTKTQVGLGSVDNTSDADKPISTATQGALDLKADATSLASHTGDKANPHGVTASQVGLGNVDNTADADKPVSTAQKAALDLKADLTALNAHKSDKANPHGVTKAQVGLSDVDNTSDADKPISTATQEALDLKADATALTGYVPTTRKVNGKPLSADVALTYEDVGALSADTYIPEGSVVDPDFSTTSVNPLQNKVLTAKIAELATSADLTAHTGSTSNPHKVTAAQVGLGNVNNTSDADKPVSTATQKALDAKATTAALTAHTGNTSNPHSVTKAQVGLGNVNNTSDADKPISTATQTALDKKASTADLTAHTGRTDNPHGVTKAQVGLGNVNNTSDADKPVSTATQTALDAKVDKVTGKGLSTNDLTDALYSKLSDLYTKAQIDALVAGVAWSVSVVDTLPTTGQAQTIYFVPKTGSGSDTHDEYIWVDGAWELIGSTQVTIDLATSTSDGLMSKQHVQTLGSTVSGLATAQSDISSIKTEQTTQNSHLSNLDTSVGNKVDKVSGKGLSTNDFTAALLTKLNGIAAGAQVNVIETIKLNGTAQTVSSKAVNLALTKSSVGLGNVDNTADTAKPISTATQTALNAKAGFYRGTFSGDGSTTSFTLTHGLGAMPHVQIWKGSSLVLTDTECTTTTVKITFNTAPASGTSYTVVAIG